MLYHTMQYCPVQYNTIPTSCNLDIYLTAFFPLWVSLLRFFRRVESREATIQELLTVHTETHVRNYCCTPSVTNEPESMVTDNDQSTATSISSILNAEDSNAKTRHGSGPGAMMRGVGGDVVVQADADQIRRQHRRYSSAVPTKFSEPSQLPLQTAQDSTIVPITPPTLICKMTCGELGIGKDGRHQPFKLCNICREKVA